MLTHMEEFSGNWLIRTVDGNEDFLISLTVSGSDGSDGTFAGGTDSPINLIVDGERWQISMEFVEMLAFGGPLPSQIRCLYSFDLRNGLVKTFTDVPGGLFEPDNGLAILRCKSLDPFVNPFGGAVNPYDFTIEETMLRETL